MSLPLTLLLPLTFDAERLPEDAARPDVGVIEGLDGPVIERMVGLIDWIPKLREREPVIEFRVADNVLRPIRLPPIRLSVPHPEMNGGASSAEAGEEFARAGYAAIIEDKPWVAVRGEAPVRADDVLHHRVEICVDEESLWWRVVVGHSGLLCQTGDVYRHDWVKLYAEWALTQTGGDFCAAFRHLVAWDTDVAAALLGRASREAVRAVSPSLLAQVLATENSEARLQAIAAVRHLGMEYLASEPKARRSPR